MNERETARRVAVFGGGVMGVGIGTLLVGHGVPVTLIEVDRERAARARTGIAGQLRHAQLMGVLPPDRPAGDLATGVSVTDAAGSTVVIEAVTEDSGLKAKLLAEVAAVVAAGTPLVTNTSSIPVDELAGALPDPTSLVGTHFMNPAYLIKAVEVIRGSRTGEPAMAAVTALLTSIGRAPTVVRDAPGFVTSRLLHPMINDAVRVVQEGTAGVEDVDALMRGCLGHPTGPLRTADLIGLDNLADSLRVLYERTADPGCQPAELLLRKVRDGHLGRKSGRGFYDDYGRALP
ncbi:3-hydroxyacyl-CoA dehydrogenase family protein [Phytohabitans houttuyneae]|uniref:3-hydroxybutyryl-CoA dehydrogenase n=1 Tax=Phytohabitans houttuyneae TaxID=1076126 RepID=A0A6V8KFF3_9ACTN|nr:3-hydroxyacyl-CoA dehydrogenase family protein [Phytohabitans houttuyneae]GFJ80789.1 3-hydroxybutyryl-CoA dehydrogenase [Phytohabitans houttuyneae]